MMDLLGQRYRAWIVPYVEGTLDARRRAKLEAWLAHDPVLAAEAEAERRVSARLREAAQATEKTGNSLWPSIQARLEPHRPSIRPLILVGGLSAATASLIAAAAWGPLKPSVPLPKPNQVAAVNSQNLNVVIAVPPPVDSRKHPGHSHHTGGAGRRPAGFRVLPLPSAGMQRDETQPQDLLAVAPPDAPDTSGADGTPTVPKFTPDSRNFRLTGNEHSREEAPPDATPTDKTVPTGTADAPAGGAGTTDAPSNDAERTTRDASPSATATPSDPTASKPAAAPHHRRQRHSHRRRAALVPAASPPEHRAPVPAVPDASASSQDAPSPPKARTKPVD